MSRFSFSGLQILSEWSAVRFDAMIGTSFLHCPDLIFYLLGKIIDQLQPSKILPINFP